MSKGPEVKTEKTPTQGSGGDADTGKLGRPLNLMDIQTHRLPDFHDAHVTSVRKESRGRTQE